MKRSVICKLHVAIASLWLYSIAPARLPQLRGLKLETQCSQRRWSKRDICLALRLHQEFEFYAPQTEFHPGFSDWPLRLIGLVLGLLRHNKNNFSFFGFRTSTQPVPKMVAISVRCKRFEICISQDFDEQTHMTSQTGKYVLFFWWLYKNPFRHVHFSIAVSHVLACFYSVPPPPKKIGSCNIRQQITPLLTTLGPVINPALGPVINSGKAKLDNKKH